MDRRTRDGLVCVQGLAARELDEVVHLMELCNDHEGLDLPLYLPRAESLPLGAPGQFLYYHQGMLTGYLASDAGNEACGMVHPEYRRQGIGRALVAAVEEQYRQRGIDRWFLICDEASPSGPAFARALGARRRQSEYRMEWTAVRPAALRHREPLALQPVMAADPELFVRTVAGAFGDPEDEVRQRYTPRLQEPERRFYLACREGEPVGTVGLCVEGSVVYITSFGVLPAHRGRGLGRQILTWALDHLSETGMPSIRIEVETENEQALSLYRSCGFRERTVYSFNEMRP